MAGRAVWQPRPRETPGPSYSPHSGTGNSRRGEPVLICSLTSQSGASCIRTAPITARRSGLCRFDPAVGAMRHHTVTVYNFRGVPSNLEGGWLVWRFRAETHEKSPVSSVDRRMNVLLYLKGSASLCGLSV